MDISLSRAWHVYVYVYNYQNISQISKLHTYVHFIICGSTHRGNEIVLLHTVKYTQSNLYTIKCYMKFNKTEINQTKKTQYSKQGLIHISWFGPFLTEQNIQTSKEVQKVGVKRLAEILGVT